MSNETTYLPWTVGQLHPEMRARGCKHLYAVFSESKIAPNVKQTVAENLTEADANLVVKAVNAHQAIVQHLRDTVQQLESVLRKYEHKTVEEFADGYYSSALAVYNSMFEARQLLATFDETRLEPSQRGAVRISCEHAIMRH